MPMTQRIPKLTPRPLFDWLDRNQVNPTGFEVRARANPPQSFPGPAYEPELDEVRLTGLQLAVFDLMKDGVWRTHGEIKQAVHRGSENGIAAVLRNLRSKKKGHHTVEKRRRGNPEDGLWEYRLIANTRSKLPC